MKISKLGAVAALAGSLFQLAIVRGKKLYWMNCLVTGGVEKFQNVCVERVSPGVKVWGRGPG